MTINEGKRSKNKRRERGEKPGTARPGRTNSNPFPRCRAVGPEPIPRCEEPSHAPRIGNARTAEPNDHREQAVATRRHIVQSQFQPRASTKRRIRAAPQRSGKEQKARGAGGLRPSIRITRVSSQTTSRRFFYPFFLLRDILCLVAFQSTNFGIHPGSARPVLAPACGWVPLLFARFCLLRDAVLALHPVYVQSVFPCICNGLGRFRLALDSKYRSDAPPLFGAE
ncbi:hypothetical protein G1C97_0443 [Bifidobacterium sp. DSM 109959]|uniref:Uncharacterized protein n=1 Tax=Bifidobacterium olomucense TaxID=2675324 RepID=A0A7Y0EW94_9BIFI|nr:hypothetical protein [Bifidobacterium sp. DSM 109959]